MSNQSTAVSAPRLSKRVLFAYGCGDFASNLTNTFMGSYLSVFYTDVVGLLRGGICHPDYCPYLGRYQ